MATKLIEKLADGSEIEITIADDKLAENLVKTRKRFSFAKKARPAKKGKDEELKEMPKPEEKLEPTETKDEVEPAKQPKVTLEELQTLPRPRLVELAKKVGVSAAGKNDAIAKRVFDKFSK